MLENLAGTVRGQADPRLASLVAKFEAAVQNDPDYSFQAFAFHRGNAVLDVWGGPHLNGDSLLVPWSVTKNIIGFSVALLVQRGELDLDERVATYWPEFAEAGKQSVTVRMLLSHQAGLPLAVPALSWDELLDHHAAAEKLARTRPLWHPGSAFGYHAMSIGNLADELVFRATGRTLHAYYEEEIRRPNAIDFYLGLPPELDSRRVPLLPMIRPAAPADLGPMPPLLSLVGSAAGPAIDFSNDEKSWRFGHPGGSGTGSARGIASLFAASVTGIDGAQPLLDADTVAIVGQQQVRGYDEVLGQAHRSHSIVFQKPTPGLPLGGPRAFGHDGAMGGLGVVDPDTGIAFAYTIVRGAWPGGADPRALAAIDALAAALAD